jgi:5'-phosphate synthase pdxT subunit
MGCIGVLAFQGGFAPHLQLLSALGHRAVPVRHASELAALDGLVLPGGESTVQLRFLEASGMVPALDAFARSGKPVLATCAGLILAARRVTHPTQRSFGWLDVEVSRNGWGRQLDSFEARSDEGRLPLLFIRAPRITAVGEGVDVVATFAAEPIAVRQGNVLGATFHPELLGDATLHRALFGEDAAQAAVG